MTPLCAFLLGVGCTLVVEAIGGIVLMAWLTRRANDPVKSRQPDA